MTDKEPRKKSRAQRRKETREEAKKHRTEIRKMIRAGLAPATADKMQYIGKEGRSRHSL